MRAKSNKTGNNGSLHGQLKNPKLMAHRLGTLDELKRERRDVPDEEKNICIIKSGNRGALIHQWVGHLPGKMENYYRKDARGAVFLVSLDVWRKPGNGPIINRLIDKILAERNSIDAATPKIV